MGLGNPLTALLGSASVARIAMFKRSSFVLGLIISLMAVAHGMDETGAPEVWYCRMADGAAHTSCGLPYELVREGLPEGLCAPVFFVFL